jgi:hypothetical protein
MAKPVSVPYFANQLLGCEDMNQTSHIIAALGRLRNEVANAPGHSHLYGEFDGILGDFRRHRGSGVGITSSLAQEIRTTVDLLLEENMVGRRPWSTGGWETYFSKCMEDAHSLLKEFALFLDYRAFCPLGYCNRFLTAFEHMDRHAREYEERYSHWSRHFARLASLAAEMFSLVADSAARVEAAFLDHPDDNVFTWLLSGYARSRKPEAAKVLDGYLTDDEAWVRRLAEKLIYERTKDQPSAAADGENAAAEP